MQICSHNSAGVNETIFEKADWYIRNRLNGVYAFLAVKNGQVLFEEYYNGHDLNSLSHIASITKSITSALVGIAISNNSISSVNQPLSDFLGTYKNKGNSYLDKVRIIDLLTMSSGIQFSKNFFHEKNWIEYFLGLQYDIKSYKHFKYEDGNAHLVSAVLRSATGMSIREYANKYLFSKIEINEIGENETVEITQKRNVLKWGTDPQGLNTGGWGLHLTARDMAKIGCLYQNNGMWNGKRIIPSDWITESTDICVKIDNWRSIEKGYGYYWWIGEEKGYKYYFSRGRGEQYILVVPKINMVFVFKCDENSVRKSNIGLFWKVHILDKLIDNLT